MTTRFKKNTDERVEWAIIGDAGAISFWMFKKKHSGLRLGGVEEHRRTPNEYQKSQDPSHKKCFLLDGPCWHDGSSLAAERYFPILDGFGEEGVYIMLEDEYHSRFMNEKEND